MNRLFRTAALMAACTALCLSPVDTSAQRPGARPGHEQQSRPGGSGNRPGSRPGGNNGNHNGHRPGGGGSNNGHRPGGGGSNNGHRPGGGGSNNGHRPGGSGSNNGHRPGGGGNWGGGNNWRPGGGGGHNRPNPPTVHPGGHRPGFGNNWHPGGSWNPGRPPMRPHRPVVIRPYTRPIPPHGWRPRPGYPTLGGFLGLTFGTTLNVSVNYLMNNGYTIDGYADNTVYLRDVRAMNYMWNDAALFYTPSGALSGSTFYYSTPFYDLARYNSVYNSLTATYGLPVSSTNGGGSISATWFGSGGYITLNFNSMASAGGPVRFFTTLTFGN